jgi:hypothetical protein
LPVIQHSSSGKTEVLPLQLKVEKAYITRPSATEARMPLSLLMFLLFNDSRISKKSGTRKANCSRLFGERSTVAKNVFYLFGEELYNAHFHCFTLIFIKIDFAGKIDRISSDIFSCP